MNYISKYNQEVPNWIGNLMAFDSLDDLKINLFRGFSGFSSLPKRLIIIGASPLISDLVDNLIEKNSIIEGIFDQDIKKHGTFFKDIRVRSFNEIGAMELNIPVLLGTHRVTNIFKVLKRLNFQQIWPFPLFSLFDVSFKPHPFYSGILEELFKNREQIIWLFNTLSDEKSKRILDTIVGFRLTFNPALLDEFIDPSPYFPQEIFNFSHEEFLIDGGAYNGDSITIFKSITSDKFKCIVPFEPSISIFKSLEEKFVYDNRIIPINACLFSENTILLFDNTKGRASAISKSNGNKCQAFDIDSLPYADEITFIKLNIEGAEPDALLGAAIALKKNQPKLACAVYHRPDHLWYLAKIIKSINPNYKLYLRQHDGGIIETVLYAK